MRKVLQQASGEGFVRVIADEGAAVVPLLHAMRARPPEPAAPHDPVLAEHVQRLLDLLGASAPLEAVAAGPAALAPPQEPLTRKEIRVLQLLAEGHSNGAIAGKLFISDSTVRTHLRNINTKLGATSRTHAVALARCHGAIR
jgi:LuxR family maltose regulon positive regulatory protein